MRSLPSPARVAQSHLLSQPGSASTSWLKKLEAFLMTEDEAETYWQHSWGRALAEVRRVLRQGDDRYPPLSSVQDLYDRIQERELLDPEQFTILKSRGPKLSAPKRPSPSADPRVIIEQLRDVLPVPLSVSYEQYLGPQHVVELEGWLKAFRTLRSKYPFPWKMLGKHGVRVVLEAKPNSSATAWFGLWITINLRGEKAWGGVETLIHEIGHAFEEGQADQHDIASWRGLYGNPPFSHQYMPERAVEDFAEVFRQYHTEKALLKAKAPDKYVDMKRRVTKT